MGTLSELEKRVKALECEGCNDILYYDTFDDFPTTGRVSRIYVAKDTGVTYIWNELNYITPTEERISLNDATPAFTPADINNPTTEEVEIWADANLTQHQKDNGKHYRNRRIYC